MGDDYQLLLLCLCLWRVLKNKISDLFLATELPEAEKFDDVVIKYKHEDRMVLRFLHAKHREEPHPPDSIHKITLTDLLTPDEGKEFSLLKYFRSFMKILEKRSQNPVPAFLEGADIQEFILSTNIDLAEEVEQYFEVDKEDSLEEDKVLRVPTGQTRKLKIKEADNELTRELEILFYTSSDFDELVEKLTDCLLLQQRFDGTSRIFEEYYYPLVKHVLEFTREPNQMAKLSDGFKGVNSERTTEVEEFRKALIKEVAFRMILREINKSTSTENSVQNRYPQSGHINDSQLTEELKAFVDQSNTAVYSALRRDETLFYQVVYDKTMEIHDDFVNGTKKLSRKAQLFRKRLIDEVMDRNMAEIVFNQVSGETFPVTEGYPTRFQPKSNPKIEDEYAFATEIEDLIDKCTDNTIEITDVVGTEEFRRNIIDLIGHAIVKVYTWFEFSASFIRSYSSIQHLRNLRLALQCCLDDKFNSIDEYKLNIQLKGFTSCEETTLHKTLPSPVTKQSIEDFYENFRLIVSYPNRYGLRELLETEVKAENQHLNSKAFVDSFVQEIHQWMTHRLGPFYTPKKAEELLRRLDENLLCYELDGINQPFFLALPTRYQFKCEDLMTLVKDFLQQTESSVLLLRAENLTLCRVRFMQAFWNLLQQNQNTNGELSFYLRRFGYLFITIEHFLAESFRKKLNRRNQDKDRWNLTVVECWAENLPGAEKFESMLDLLFENSESSRSMERRVIFIVKEDMSRKLESALGSYFTKQGNTHTFELKTTFSQLEAPSQDELLRRGQVKLHGHCFQLGDIVNQDAGDLIDETTFAKLIAEGEGDARLVRIGSIIQSPDFYIKRCIRPPNIETNNDRIETSIYIFENREKVETEVAIAADSRDKFNEIKEVFTENRKYSAPYSVHWVQEKKPRHDERWIWYGSIEPVSRFGSLEWNRITFTDFRKEKMIKDKKMITDEQFLEYVKDNKIVILHGVPGMGKSMLLRNFFIQMTNNSQLLWKIYINLNLYTNFLDKRQNFFKENQNEAGDRVDTETPSSRCSEFLFELLQSNEHSKLKTQFEINLLHSAFKSEANTKMRLVLFMDGFDEISPNYMDIVLGFLLLSKACSDAPQIFITTRPSYREYLKQQLQTFSFELLGLTWTEQISLYTEVSEKLEMQIDEEEKLFSVLETCADLEFDSRCELFTRVPLCMIILTEVFNTFRDEERIKKVINDRDLSTLYEMYFKRKYELYLDEKMRLNRTNLSPMEESEYTYDAFLNNHTNLALWAMFSRKDLKGIVSSFQEFEGAVSSLLADIEAGEFEYGIVHGVSDGKPEFFHHTFAGYLVARFFISQITSNNQLESGFLEFSKSMLMESFGDVRRFCDGMVREISWDHDHFANVSPGYVVDGLICSYRDNFWGIFSFFAKIFKTYCPKDVCAENIANWRDIRDYSDDGHCTWQTAFTYLLGNCYYTESNFVLYRFLLKWRPENVRRSLTPPEDPDKIQWQVEYRLFSASYNFKLYMNNALHDDVHKLLPTWLIQQEGFNISVDIQYHCK
ncbi:unnamed protein product [Hermetia illucens]|uniref:NACHT domain-containing protein n=1 Tax=Hermetia illucens TaxID=343691 RepID=A0A7R8UU47_HERIL|nr:uncharacterized protein LOC119654508 [Hermetia illucens]CAD7086638.1 unnamed protein product [Hermetia illucens]